MIKGYSRSRKTWLSYTQCTRWFKYDRDWFLCKQAAYVPVIFEPPCTQLLQQRCWRDTSTFICAMVDSSRNVMAHGDAREGKWRGNWRMEWVASTLHTTSEHGVSSIINADAHSSAASSRLNWRPRRFKWTRPFRRKTKSGFCACVITFQLASTNCFSSVTRSTGVFSRESDGASGQPFAFLRRLWPVRTIELCAQTPFQSNYKHKVSSQCL